MFYKFYEKERKNIMFGFGENRRRPQETGKQQNTERSLRPSDTSRLDQLRTEDNRQQAAHQEAARLHQEAAQTPSGAGASSSTGDRLQPLSGTPDVPDGSE